MRGRPRWTADRSVSMPRVAMRLAAAHAASTCVTVVDAAWTLAGGTAVYDTSPLGRCVRDAHVVTQHIMVAPKLNETLGKHLLGRRVQRCDDLAGTRREGFECPPDDG